jgi:uncharacterized protein (TIGR03086 family)
MDPIERIEKATEEASKAVAGVKLDQLSNPTPCAEYDLKGVLEHMIGGLEMLRSAAETGKAVLPEGTDWVGSDPSAAYDAGREKLLAAIRSPGALEKNWEMPFGAMPGAMMAGIAFMEHLTHAWDVKKATGQDTALPDDLVNECLELVTPMDAMLRMPGVCGPKVEVPADASPTDKLAGFMGRQP